MPDPFTSLSAKDRKDALEVAAAQSGRPPHILEKDVWVVRVIDALFASPHGGHLVFKGGTSLSKAYGVIDRFSEDVDVTFDIRQLIGDLIGDRDPPIPPTPSQARKWIKEIKARLPDWIEREVVPILANAFADQGAINVGEEGVVELRYTPIFEGPGYVAPAVRLEFGARSTGEPCAPAPIACDAAPHLPSISFPTATPRVMKAERTFWEKATAIHVFCLQRDPKTDRFARHWYDLYRLDAVGLADAAIADRALARAVAEHKAMFFREKAGGEAISYEEAVSSGLRLVPEGAPLAALEADYVSMIDEGLFFDAPPSFAELMKRCGDIERRANAGH